MCGWNNKGEYQLNNISVKVDITKEFKSYFKKNGYDFMNPEEEEDDDDWDDDW